MPRLPARPAATLVAALTAAACSTALAQSPPPQLAATDLSIEQLMNVEVTGVSRAQERLLDAPASVTVITADDIRAFGYRTLADLLNGVRGMFTYTDRSYSFVGVRGFAPVGDYNTRVLLLIDGYRANDNFYDQASIGSEALIDLDLIERVEVIRGPASSVYGTNAFFGVINVVTRSASSLATALHGIAGSGRERGGSATLAGRVGDASYWYLRATRVDADGFDIDFPQAADRLPGGGRYSGVDGSSLTRVFARAVTGNWRLTAGHAQRSKDSGYGLYASDVGDPDALSRDEHSFVDLRWEGPLGEATDLAVRGFAARYYYQDAFLFGGDRNRGTADGKWFGTEWLLTHRLDGRQRLLAGFEAQRDAQLDQAQSADSLGLYLDDRRSGSRFGVFAQHDREWSPAWATSLGLRWDQYRGGSQASPRAALIFKPDAASALKLMAGTAFRAPNGYERYYAFPGFYAPNPDLKAEHIRTYDLDYETLLGRSTRLALGAFRYRAEDLVTQVVDSAGLLQYVNAARVDARGLDAEIEHELTPDLRLRGVLSLQRVRDAGGGEIENSPRRVARGSALWRFNAAGWRLGAEAVHVDGRRTSIAAVPSYTTANLTLSSPLQRRGLDFSASIYNLADRRAEDPIPAGGLPVDLDRIAHPGRTWQLRLGYAF